MPSSPRKPAFPPTLPVNASADAVAHLSQVDPVLAGIIQRGRAIQPAAHEDLYLALLRAIVSQQISTKAAAAIWRIPADCAASHRETPAGRRAFPARLGRAAGRIRLD